MQRKRDFTRWTALVAAASLTVAIATSVVYADTTTWNGGTGNWSDDNWDNGIPQPGDTVQIASGAVTLANSTPSLSAITVTNAILTFTNWSTALIATNVTIQHGATLTLPAPFLESQMSNRVYVVCSNLFLADGAAIQANALGFAGSMTGGQGPGKPSGDRAGAGHGSFGGNFNKAAGLPYGSTNAPLAPGSSGGKFGTGRGGHGGGAVFIDADGTVTVNGSILASGDKGSADNTGGGSGGSVYIDCRTFAGTGGVVQANGGNGRSSGGCGAGGRIAIVYNTAAQSSAPAHSVTLSALPGSGGSYPADLGTLFLSNGQFIANTIVHSGQFVIPGFTNWEPDTLVVDGGWVRFTGNGMHIAATNDIIIKGASATLEMGGNTFFQNGIYYRGLHYLPYSDMTTGLTLEAGGSLILTNGGTLVVYAPATNAPSPGYSALVAATNGIDVYNGSTIRLWSHPTNGASVKMTANELLVASDGTIDANERGYTQGNVYSGAGYGPGAGGYRAGAAYGGFGGSFSKLGGMPYGSTSAPHKPGSGGGNYANYYGSSGGGLVWFELNGTATVHGVVSANGGAASANCGAGSGGGIAIACSVLQGQGGTFLARGGSTSSSAGNGGGGRIAIVYDPTAQSNAPAPAVSFATQPGSGGTFLGDLGTLYVPDGQLLGADLSGISAQLLGVGAWTTPALALTNSWVRFAADGVQVHVTGDVIVDGASGRLDIGGGHILDSSIYRPNYELPLYSDGNPALLCDGALSVTNGATLCVFAGPTNALSPGYGARLAVTGAVSVAADSWIRPVSHPTNGGSVFMRVGDFTAAASGGIVADWDGYAAAPDAGSTIGFGPGGGGTRSGAGYGGIGGYSAPGGTYGSSNAPVQCGSGGGDAGGIAGFGGGLIWLETVGTVALDGTFQANGGRGTSGLGSGGSGGGIMVRCRTLTGSGALSADGGNHADGGGGGGGRIAVWRAYDSFAISASVAPGVSRDPQPTTGTVVRLDTGPSITNLPAANVTADTADLVATLTATGIAPVEVYCYWGPTNEDENKAAWQTNDYLGFRTPGTLTNHVSDLSSPTQYYYNFYATNAYGDNWGTPATLFATVGGAAVENDGGATNVTPTGATLRGTVVSGNPTPNAYICWGDNDPGTDSTSAWDTALSLGLQAAAFETNVNGLLANRTYYYRCYVTNANGEGWASAATNFTTRSPTVSVTDVAVTEGASGTTTDAVLTVSISDASYTPVSVNFTANSGTATVGSGTDVDATNGTLTIAAGNLADTIAVTVNGDSVDEFPWELFTLDLDAPVGVVFGDSQGLCTIHDDDDTAETKTWNGTGTWTNHAAWTPFGMPSPSDSVLIESGTVMIAEPRTVASLVVNTNAAMVFTNWSTRLTAASVEVRTNATITLPAAFTDTQMSNRVWIACGDFVLHAGGSIDADGKGFAAAAGPVYGYGPGSTIGIRGGAGHGGVGGNFSWDNGWTYGSTSAPTAPGSGADGTSGGGAVYIDATGTVTVNGTITARGGDSATLVGCGSGGSILINCQTFAGTNGQLRVDGGNTSANNGAGGGGRIAVVYDTGAQQSMLTPTVTCSARGGSAPYYAGGHGTIYLPDTQLLAPVMGRFHGELVGFGAWTVESLTVSNSLVHFSAPGFLLTVSNDLVVTGTAADLRVGGASVRAMSRREDHTAYRRFTDSAAMPTIYVGGGATVTDGGVLQLYSAATNGVTPAYGALLDVAGNLAIAPNARIYTDTHPTNGAAPLIRVGGNMTVAALGTISGDARGFAGVPIGTAFGPGTGGLRAGAGYGGAGGDYPGTPGQTYGSSNAPALPGSGASQGIGSGEAGNCGGNGGAKVWIDVAGTVSLAGTISANGGNGGTSHAGGGSGGAIFIDCGAFEGDGRLTANGGDWGSTAAACGGGGGGRIAVWYGNVSETDRARIEAGANLKGVVIGATLDDFSGTVSVVGGEAGAYDGYPGTALFLTVPPPSGTIITIR